ncbi:hypothetical protein NFJ02_02g71670 [Pycnococcus provasolii]
MAESRDKGGRRRLTIFFVTNVTRRDGVPTSSSWASIASSRWRSTSTRGPPRATSAYAIPASDMHKFEESGFSPNGAQSAFVLTANGAQSAFVLTPNGAQSAFVLTPSNNATGPRRANKLDANFNAVVSEWWIQPFWVRSTSSKNV